MVDPNIELIVQYYEAKQEAYELKDLLRSAQLALFRERETVKQLVHVMYECGLDPNKVLRRYDSLELVHPRPRFVPPTHFTELPWLVRKRYAFDGWHDMVPSDLSRAEMALAHRHSAGSGPLPPPPSRPSLNRVGRPLPPRLPLPPP